MNSIKTTSPDSLCFKDLSAFYNKTPVLNHIDFELSRKEFLCLCGPNGCGKSTLLNILCGLKPDSLNITATEMPALYKDNTKIASVYKMNSRQRALTISFMCQNETSLWNFSVFDVVLSGRYPHSNYGFYTNDDKEKAFLVLQTLGLEALSDRKINSLSGGEFQKIRIARALCTAPAFLILDEPFSSLDFIAEPELMEFLKNKVLSQNIGIAVSIHNINLAARFADKLLLLPACTEAPYYFYGSPVQVLTDENISFTYKKKLQTYRHPIYNCIQVK